LVEIVTDWRGLPDGLKGAAVAIGAFDGVHRGHTAVIERAREAAQRLRAPLGVVSFYPHPRRWFRPSAAPFRLMTPGQMVRALAPLGVERLYLLPFDARTVLVEDTYYSDSPALDRTLLGSRIDSYARSRGWTVEAVIEEEQGVLPIALDGDIAAFWEEEPGIARAGLLAALFHPVTGYSLPDAVGLAREIAREPALTSAGLRALTENRSRRLWRERRFYRLLNRMLFHAAAPDQRWRVFQRFYGLPEGVVRRFYAGRSTALDKARILAGKPPVPVEAALRQLRETGRGSST